MQKRLRTYYTENEITTDLYTYGQEWMTIDNIEYIGLYHRYITGEIYTGNIWNASTSKQLIPYQDTSSQRYQYSKLKPNIKTNFDSIIFSYPTPSQTDIKNGYMNRFFIKRYDAISVNEIDKSQHDKWKSSKIDPILYQSVSIKWQLTGPEKTITVNGNTVLGVYEINLNTIQQTEKILPGISLILTNPLQYYSDTTNINIPPDINE